MLPAGHPHGACGVLRKEAHRCPLAAGVLLTPRKQTAHTCRALGMGRSARMAVCTPSVRARLLRPVDFPPQTTSRCSQGESPERLKAESTDMCQRGPRKQPTGSSASAGERPRGLSEPRPAAQASPWPQEGVASEPVRARAPLSGDFGGSVCYSVQHVATFLSQCPLRAPPWRWTQCPADPTLQTQWGWGRGSLRGTRRDSAPRLPCPVHPDSQALGGHAPWPLCLSLGDGTVFALPSRVA